MAVMFEAAETGHKLSKDRYKKRAEQLRTELIQAQYELRGAAFPVIVLVAGDDRPGCDDVIYLLNDWLDPRFVNTAALAPPTEEERQRPRFWRIWRALPMRGRVGIFMGGWSQRMIEERLGGLIDEATWLREISHARRLEEMLVRDGAVIVKFWLHLPKAELKKRLQAAESDPDKEWRFQAEDWEMYESYSDGQSVVEAFLRKTSTANSPWHVVESTDSHYRDITVAEIVLQSIQQRIDNNHSRQKLTAAPPQAVHVANGHSEEDESAIDPHHTLLDTIDLTQHLPKKEYEQQLREYQARLHGLARTAHERGQSILMLFEGWDAAGKGSAIRRLVKAVNPRMYQIVSIAAPSEDELKYHYLWRFWKHLPLAGRFLIFDRSWYGRVLVERVEGYARKDEWQRAYNEINDFEEQLTRHGYLLEKFWMHISKDEQSKRFKKRESVPYKRFKITPDDYRNRKRWPDYEAAANEMFARTGTSYAPWHLVAANNKRWARIEVLRTVCESLSKRLEID